MYAAAAYVSELVGPKKNPKRKKEPWWKRRLKELIHFGLREQFT